MPTGVRAGGEVNRNGGIGGRIRRRVGAGPRRANVSAPARPSRTLGPASPVRVSSWAEPVRFSMEVSVSLIGVAAGGGTVKQVDGNGSSRAGVRGSVKTGLAVQMSSAPEPPMRVSEPAPPIRVSSPSLPSSTLSAILPVTLSSPDPATYRSMRVSRAMMRVPRHWHWSTHRRPLPG